MTDLENLNTVLQKRHSNNRKQLETIAHGKEKVVIKGSEQGEEIELTGDYLKGLRL